jgi:hypothetical protein
MEAYLNELSLSTYSTCDEVKASFDIFKECMKTLSGLGITIVRVPSCFDGHRFLYNKSYRQILGDKSIIDEDLKTWLISTLGTLHPEDKIEDMYNITAMSVNGTACKGLGVSCERITNSISISFTHTEWTQQEYTVSVTTLDEEAEEETFESRTRHTCSAEQCRAHQDALQKLKTYQIQTGNELWIRRKELFPNLDFCACVKAQMKALRNNTPELEQVIIKLCELQRAAANCKSNKRIQESDFTSKVTPESTPRKQAFANRLTFLCPDGKLHLCEWHARYTPGAGRIHFYPIESEKIFYIGYIGGKIQ